MREFRGVWVATVANMDWPSRPGLPADSARLELVRILDHAVRTGLNAVIFQVRPSGDALYASRIEPWSEYLTGRQGTGPEGNWDPLAFVIAEAHARGLELHAWFNPYRAKDPSAKGPLAATHLARQSPGYARKYGRYLWFDPGEPAVRKRTARVVLDGALYKAAAFADPSRTLLEAHLLDFADDAYGKEITVELLEKIRDAHRFENDEMLKAAIASDVPGTSGIPPADEADRKSVV